MSSRLPSTEPTIEARATSISAPPSRIASTTMKISAALPNVALSSALSRGPADSPACSVATLRTCAMPATARPATTKITTDETPAAAMSDGDDREGRDRRELRDLAPGQAARGGGARGGHAGGSIGGGPRAGAWDGVGILARAVRFLLTNDDGIGADGLRALVPALAAHGEVVVIAPLENQSGVARKITLSRPLAVDEVAVPGATAAFAVDGTPVDCVRLGAHGLAGPPPDVVVSGANHGLNLGDDVTYSGTVAAAFEGHLLGLPAIAVSQQSPAGELGFAGGVGLRLQPTPRASSSGWSARSRTAACRPGCCSASTCRAPRHGARCWHGWASGSTATS